LHEKETGPMLLSRPDLYGQTQFLELPNETAGEVDFATLDGFPWAVQ
jgi:hypothetical protein